MVNLKTILIFLSVFIFITACSTNLSRKIASDNAFDEVYGTTLNSDIKKVRIPYLGIIDIHNNLTDKQKFEFEKKSLQLFEGDNALASLPRVLSQEEYNLIRKGTYQRAKAISAFLKDHYSGKKLYLDNEIIPKAVIDRITERAGESEWEKYLTGENISFWYGPDIIRGPPTKEFPEGKFFIVEDNPSFIGGMGDLLKAREIMDKLNPEYQKIANSPDPKNFYKRLTDTYKKKAQEFDGVAVVVQYTRDIAADNEDKRIKELFSTFGIETVEFDPLEPSHKFPKLTVDENNVTWIVKKDGIKEKVGYVIGNLNPADLEPTHPVNRKYLLKEVAEWAMVPGNISRQLKKQIKRALRPGKLGKIDYQILENLLQNDYYFKKVLNNKNLGIPGIMKSFSLGKIGLTNTPGLEFVGDKEFYIYVENLIKFYLNEEPVLSNMKTESFSKIDRSGSSLLDQTKLDHVFENFEKYVVKGVDGRGGDAVWVGPKTDEATKRQVRLMIEENPQRYIFQEYKTLSTINGNIGDLRMISDVHADKINVANVPWARVVSESGDGKVNISSNGFEATVLIRRKPAPMCNDIISQIIK